MANAKIAQYYDYVTPQGVIVPDVSTVLSEIQETMKSLFGQNLDTAPETAQGRLIEMFQRSRTFTIQAMAAVSNLLNLNTAGGFVLDDIGALFLISRQPATYTTTTVVLAGEAGTIVPAGTRFQNELGDVFVLENQYVIGDSAPIVRAENTGPIPCPPNTLTTILDAVNGLETVINPGAPTLGTDQESDNVFRQRIKNSLNINSIAVLSAIKANLENLPGVVGTYCYDNYTDAPITIDEVIVPAHSLLAVVDGGDPQAIAQVLYSKKSAGCGYISGTTEGSDVEIVTETVIDEAYGTPYTVKFARPDLVDIKIEITVARQDYTGTTLEQDVQNAIMAWMAGEIAEVDAPVIGGFVSPFEISAAVSSQIPAIGIRNVLIAADDGTPAAITISLDEIQKANILASNITVTITDN